MKKLPYLTEEQIKNYKLIAFECYDCRVYVQHTGTAQLVSNKSRGTYRVLLETAKNSNIYMELLFDECYDIKNPRTGAPNKSKAGNPYIGFLYCPRSAERDRAALETWKKETVYRYPRLQDCLRFVTGIFTDCGLDIKDFTSGMVKYDELIEYVKAWEHHTVVGHPYQKNFGNTPSILELCEDVPDDSKKEMPFNSIFDMKYDDGDLPF